MNELFNFLFGFAAIVLFYGLYCETFKSIRDLVRGALLQAKRQYRQYSAVNIRR